MPKYEFKCSDCDMCAIMHMSISEYMQNKKTLRCLKCDAVMQQVVGKVFGAIDRSAYEIVEQAKEENRKIIEKIESGDEKTFVDIYGDKPNSYKK